jgi:hypothetical protein
MYIVEILRTVSWKCIKNKQAAPAHMSVRIEERSVQKYICFSVLYLLYACVRPFIILIVMQQSIGKKYKTVRQRSSNAYMQRRVTNLSNQ